MAIINRRETELTNVVGSGIDVFLTTPDGIPINTVTVSGITRLLVQTEGISGGGGGNTKIEGDSSGNVAEVTASNELKTTAAVTSLPSITLASQASPFTSDLNVSLDGETVDVSDRAARDLGKVDIAAFDTSLPAGTNNIGDVDILTLPDVTQPTHDNLNLNANLQIGDVDASTSNPVPAKELRSGTATTSNVVSIASNTTILAANASRLGATVYNDSTKVLFLKFGATASATSFTVRLSADDYYEVPYNYTGVIDGIWAMANGNARVTELT